ncbi:MAG: hypothetical protein U0169_17570 [Polyangiaceae bacterium]
MKTRSAPLSLVPRERATCVVCEESDRRALLTRRLPGLGLVDICGSHGLMYDRLEDKPTTREALVAALGERREPRERRGFDEDELSRSLADAFTHDRRVRHDRRIG